MSVATDVLPLMETHAPDDPAALAAWIADAYAREHAVYPIGGGTSLDYGLSPSRPGIGLSLANLSKVIDYPARDMTITVEAGMTIERLAETLASGGQWLPIDAPQATTATLGGVMATGTCGPRRFGYGTLRDYVIGVCAVDGRGVPFKAGGRVVKNVAGYDFCKLLTGSLGTLGVITQITLKLKPKPQSSAFLACELADAETAERLLAALVHSNTSPAAVELLAGPVWRNSGALGSTSPDAWAYLAVGLEGSQSEVHWMLEELAREWQKLGVNESHEIVGDQAAALWGELCEFPVAPAAPLVVKMSTLPSQTVDLVRLIGDFDAGASVQAHANNGIVVARFATFEAGDLSRWLIGRLQPAAGRAGGGGTTVLSSTLSGLTRQAVWGANTDASIWMRRVKEQFDPKNLLNPGRFVYEGL